MQRFCSRNSTELPCVLLRRRAADRDEGDLSQRGSSSKDSHLRWYTVNYSLEIAQIPLSIKRRMHFSWGSLSKRSSEAVPAGCDEIKNDGDNVINTNRG